MTRARWLTAALIGVAALIIAGESLVTYVAERLIVGAVAVVVLMGVLAIGFASLARARRYIAGELSALGAEPPAGSLYQSRRAQLVSLRQRGVSPDLDLLADATAAAEAERGYTGKYLVATTVLIGLVGTFGGLMETLGRAAPLLKGDLPSNAGGPSGALALLAGPLAGLHVTFGTSVVAIVVTLALALVQGDVTLQHERLLALLQERTRHVLMPELWPAAETTGERTVRALLELRAFVAESLTTSSTASAEKIAGVVRVEVQRMVGQVRAEMQAAAGAQTAALQQTSSELTGGFRKTTETAAQELRDAAATSRQAMTAAATASREVAAQVRSDMQAAAAAQAAALDRASTALTEGFRRTTEAAAQELRDAATTSREAMGAAATASREAFEAAARATREEMAAAIAALAGTTERTSEAVTASTAAAVASLGEVRGSLSAQLEGTSQGLAAAAAELARAVAALSPALAELAPQLGGLTAEVALLAARADSPEQPNAVLDELVRLSEDVERLLAASQQAAATTEVAARQAES